MKFQPICPKLYESSNNECTERIRGYSKNSSFELMNDTRQVHIQLTKVKGQIYPSRVSKNPLQESLSLAPLFIHTHTQARGAHTRANETIILQRSVLCYLRTVHD